MFPVLLLLVQRTIYSNYIYCNGEYRIRDMLNIQISLIFRLCPMTKPYKIYKYDNVKM